MTKHGHPAGGGALAAIRVLLFDLVAGRASNDYIQQALLEEATCKFPGLTEDDYRIIVSTGIENFTNEVIERAIALRRGKAQGATIVEFPSASSRRASRVHS